MVILRTPVVIKSLVKWNLMSMCFEQLVPIREPIKSLAPLLSIHGSNEGSGFVAWRFMS